MLISYVDVEEMLVVDGTGGGGGVLGEADGSFHLVIEVDANGDSHNYYCLDYHFQVEFCIVQNAGVLSKAMNEALKGGC